LKVIFLKLHSKLIIKFYVYITKKIVTNISPKLKCSGEAINSTKRVFFNLYNEEDRMLTLPLSGSNDGPNLYKDSENDMTLCGFGKEIGVILPTITMK
jgi:hypothetical protein